MVKYKNFFRFIIASFFIPVAVFLLNKSVSAAVGDIEVIHSFTLDDSVDGYAASIIEYNGKLTGLMLLAEQVFLGIFFQ